MRTRDRSILTLAFGVLGIVTLAPDARAQTATVLQIDAGTSRLAITVTVAGFSQTAWTTPQGTLTLDLTPAANPASVSLRDLRVDHPGPRTFDVPFAPFGTLPVSLGPLSVRSASPGAPTPPAPLSPTTGEFTIPPIEVRFTGNAHYSTSGPICGLRLSGIAPCELTSVLTDQDPALSPPAPGLLHPPQAGPRRVSLTFQATVHLNSDHPEYGSVGILALIEAALGSTPPCPADFNGAGGVTGQDLFDFLAAWFALAPAADINGSGAITAQDLFDFLTLWFTGC